jgi:hypothetical protein
MVAQVKKGKKTWKPANVLEVEKKPGIHYRWVRTDPLHLQRKRAEGYVMASELTGTKTELVDKDSPISNAPVLVYQDMALMAIDEETKKAREEYFEERTNAQSIRPVKRAQRELEDSNENSDLIYDVTS